MCLLVHGLKIEEAQEDLVFYKVAHASEMYDGEIKLVSLYRKFPIKLGKTYIEEGDFELDGNRINGGCFHLYKHKYDAQRVAGIQGGYDSRWMCRCKAQSFLVVLKAIIPKGTKFVSGEFCDRPSIATKSVRYELFEKISEPCKV